MLEDRCRVERQVLTLDAAYKDRSCLPALDAIRTATTAAARLTGLSGSAGRLAQGFRGDAVLLAGNPLEDITAVKTPSAVISNGVVGT